jgi:hypothetical protein
MSNFHDVYGAKVPYFEFVPSGVKCCSCLRFSRDGDDFPGRHEDGCPNLARMKECDLSQTVPLLIVDDLGMRKLPLTAAEELLEIIMRRYERASTLLTSNRPVEDWEKLLGDAAAVGAMLDRLFPFVDTRAFELPNSFLDE